jgi:hypothetical protein
MRQTRGGKYRLVAAARALENVELPLAYGVYF